MIIDTDNDKEGDRYSEVHCRGDIHGRGKTRLEQADERRTGYPGEWRKSRASVQRDNAVEVVCLTSEREASNTDKKSRFPSGLDAVIGFGFREISSIFSF